MENIIRYDRVRNWVKLFRDKEEILLTLNRTIPFVLALSFLGTGLKDTILKDKFNLGEEDND
jgi:hypothetical protein